MMRGKANAEMPLAVSLADLLFSLELGSRIAVYARRLAAGTCALVAESQERQM
jgi:hypothetical protein